MQICDYVIIIHELVSKFSSFQSYIFSYIPSKVIFSESSPKVNFLP